MSDLRSQGDVGSCEDGNSLSTDSVSKCADEEVNKPTLVNETGTIEDNRDLVLKPKTTRNSSAVKTLDVIKVCLQLICRCTVLRLDKFRDLPRKN